ncbi:MAG: hypothetical protein EXS12_03330 [Phycisphaerales bacterium]|nr:hypothetical protein [Phycisphaerales bacterium]
MHVHASCAVMFLALASQAHSFAKNVKAVGVIYPAANEFIFDSSLEKWSALSKAWCFSTGAANCKVTLAVQDGDLASDRSATPSVIAWDARERKFSLAQSSLTVLVDSKHLCGVGTDVDAAVDRVVTEEPARIFRQEIPESPWPQLGMALRNQSELWWKDIDPELGEVALQSFMNKDDGTMIVMFAGKYGSLELVFNGQTSTLFAATRRIESGPRVSKNAAIEWRMTFESIAIPAGMLTLDVGDRRRVERLDDLQSPVAKKESTKESKTLMPGMSEVKPDSKPVSQPEVKPDVKP